MDVGDEVTATLTCGDHSAVVFQGIVDEVPFSFDFDVPAGFPAGPGTISVAGRHPALRVRRGLPGPHGLGRRSA